MSTAALVVGRKANRPTPHGGAVPLFNPRYLHRFTPDQHANVRSQCVHCLGWYDDPRHT